MALSFNVLLPLRVAQGILAIIVLGLTGYVANWWSGYWRSWSPSEVDFLIFASVWTILALVYLVVAPSRFPKFAHIYAVAAVEVVTMIFWFAGFIALAVFLGDRVCFGSVCSCAKAAAVFAAFEWALFVGTTVLTTLHVLSERRNGNTTAKPRGATVEVHPGV